MSFQNGQLTLEGKGGRGGVKRRKGSKKDFCFMKICTSHFFSLFLGLLFALIYPTFLSFLSRQSLGEKGKRVEEGRGDAFSPFPFLLSTNKQVRQFWLLCRCCHSSSLLPLSLGVWRRRREGKRKRGGGAVKINLDSIRSWRASPPLPFSTSPRSKLNIPPPAPPPVLSPSLGGSREDQPKEGKGKRRKEN